MKTIFDERINLATDNTATDEQMAFAMLASIGIESLVGVNIESKTVINEIDEFANESGWSHNGTAYIRDGYALEMMF